MVTFEVKNLSNDVLYGYYGSIGHNWELNKKKKSEKCAIYWLDVFVAGKNLRIEFVHFLCPDFTLTVYTHPHFGQSSSSLYPRLLQKLYLEHDQRLLITCDPTVDIKGETVDRLV